MKTAVVIGATGFIGQILIKKLAAQDVFTQIIAICRPQSLLSKQSLVSPKVRVLQFDFENWQNLELQISAFAGTSPVSFFCCLGTTLAKAGNQEAFKKIDYSYVIHFTELAKICQAEQLLIVSALGADKNSNVFYNRMKGEMEESVQNIFKNKLYIFRPSLLLGDRSEFRFTERLAILLAPAYSPFMLGKMKKYKPIQASKVAHIMTLVACKKIVTTNIFFENEQLLKTT